MSDSTKTFDFISCTLGMISIKFNDFWSTSISVHRYFHAKDSQDPANFLNVFWKADLSGKSVKTNMFGMECSKSISKEIN